MASNGPPTNRMQHTKEQDSKDIEADASTVNDSPFTSDEEHLLRESTWYQTKSPTNPAYPTEHQRDGRSVTAGKASDEPNINREQPVSSELSFITGGTPDELRNKTNMAIVRKKAMDSFLKTSDATKNAPRGEKRQSSHPLPRAPHGMAMRSSPSIKQSLPVQQLSLGSKDPAKLSSTFFNHSARGSKLPQHALQKLNGWLIENSHNPYPNADTKLKLAQESGITEKQVNTWFTNARARVMSDSSRRNSFFEDDFLHDPSFASIPLTPSDTSHESDASALLSASKSNYQHLIDGNTVPGVTYPTSLSTNLTSKRTSHKIAEQGRRNRINLALQEMQSLLPSPNVDMVQSSSTIDEGLLQLNTSKATTIEKAIDYIKHLKEEAHERELLLKSKDEEIAELRSRSGMSDYLPSKDELSASATHSSMPVPDSPQSIIHTEDLFTARTYEEDKKGIIPQIFQACLDSIGFMVKYFESDGQVGISKRDLNVLKRSLAQLKLWSDGYGVWNGRLHAILAQSAHLRPVVLSVLNSICKTLLDGLRTQEMSRSRHGDAQLQDRMIELYGHNKYWLSAMEDVDGGDSDSESDDEDGSKDNKPLKVDQMVEDIKTYTECLVDLGTALQSPAEHHNSNIKTHTGGLRALSTVLQGTVGTQTSSELLHTSNKARKKMNYPSTAVACAPKDPQRHCVTCMQLRKECNFDPIDRNPQDP